MSQSPSHHTQGHERISRRALLRTGIAATAVAVSTLASARKSGAAVTSMDRVPALQPLTGDVTPKPARDSGR